MAERLPPPLNDLLVDPTDDATLARVRARIDRQLDGPPRWSRALWIAAAALCFVAGYGVAEWRRPAAPTANVERTRDALVATHEQTAERLLEDGSRIEVERESAVRVVEDGARLVAVSLERGAARFVVSKHPERLFRVEAGDASVWVRGTTFRVERQGADAVVIVEEGVVELVSAHGARRVQAGERATTRETTLPEAPPSSAASASPPALTPAVPERRWRSMAAQGDYAGAYATLGQAGIAREVEQAPDAAMLLALADVARLSNHPRDATLPLRTLLRDHRADPRASLAAFTLGKILFDALGEPRDAAMAFDLALVLSPPAAIAEDASARRVQAWAAAGNPAKARVAAAEYRAAYPSGRYLAEVSRWTAP